MSQQSGGSKPGDDGPQWTNVIFSAAAVLVLIAAGLALLLVLTSDDDEDLARPPTSEAPSPTPPTPPVTVATSSTTSTTTPPTTTTTAPVTTVASGPSVQFDDTPGDGRQGDVISISANVVRSDVVFEIALGPTATDRTVAYIYIDGDRNPATGSPGVNGACTADPESIGSEHFIAAGYELMQNSPYIATSTGGCNAFGENALRGAFQREPGLLRITVPRNALILAGPEIAFKVITATELDPTVTSGFDDIAPDAHTPAALLTIG